MVDFLAIAIDEEQLRSDSSDLTENKLQVSHFEFSFRVSLESTHHHRSRITLKSLLSTFRAKQSADDQ